MAAACDEPKCFAGPGQFCKTPSGEKRRPHPDRVGAAARLGLLGGTGLRLLTDARKALVDGPVVTVGGVTMLLPRGAVIEVVTGAG